MKKFLFSFVVLLMTVCNLAANPVDVKMAEVVGVRYLKTNIESAKSLRTLELVYTYFDDNGNACFYVFNYDDGFVIISADDRVKPVLAYSEEGAFNVNNISDGLEYYMKHYASTITDIIENDRIATQDIIDEWNLVAGKGVITEKPLSRTVEPLVSLMWNQDYPYNSLCPVDYMGPGGHVYAGCVATAMSMVMKFWNYPERGEGSYSYTPEGYPQQTANFGETVYDWDNMPNSISAGSSQTQINAIATLMHHCGVSVDMIYGPDASGAYSNDVYDAITTYFSYSESSRYEEREDYTKYEWENMLINNFDQGLPAYYSGSGNTGGHAFICDGYNENRYFHFNWGWSGYNNGYFAIDALNVYGQTFNDYQAAYFDMVPDYVFDMMPAAVSDFAVTPENAYVKNAVVSWINPTTNPTGIQLESLSQIVLMRNGEIIFTEDNPTPGAEMNFIDEVDEYGSYNYQIYAVNDGIKGRFSNLSCIYGPTCTWKIIGTTNNFQGWNGGIVQILDANGTVFNEVTMTGSTPISVTFSMPEGAFSLKWIDPLATVSNMSIVLKNSSNNTEYSFSGSSSSLDNVIYNGENDCEGCKAPENITAEYHYVDGVFGALVSWEEGGEPQSFKVYRSNDGIDYEVVATVDNTEHEYFDVVEAGTYYYKVTAYNSYCESNFAMNPDLTSDYVMVDVTSAEEVDGVMVAVYPNPAKGFLNVVAEGMSRITVYNVLGQMVFDSDVDTEHYLLDMRGFNNGLYTVKVMLHGKEIVKRVAVGE